MTWPEYVQRLKVVLEEDPLKPPRVIYATADIEIVKLRLGKWLARKLLQLAR